MAASHNHQSPSLSIPPSETNILLQYLTRKIDFLLFNPHSHPRGCCGVTNAHGPMGGVHHTVKATMDTNFYAKSDVMSQLVESDFKHLIGLIADLDDI